MIIRFLSALFDKCYGFVEIRKIRNGQVQAEFFDLKRLSEIPIKRLGQENLDGWNIYFGVCPRNQKKGRRENVKQISALWADVDAKECGGDMEAALRQIENLPENLKPSIIVNSGNGYHCYWAFESPVIIKTTADADGIEILNKRIAAVIGGDHVGDLPRILRLPGTFNVKDPKNRKSCKIITFEPERKFRIEDFDSLPDVPNESGYINANGNGNPADKNATGQTNNGKENPKDDSLDREAKWVTKALWGAKEGKRNQTLARLAGYFKNHHPKDVTKAILLQFGSRCSPPMNPTEVEKTVDSIYRIPIRRESEFSVVRIIRTDPPYYILGLPDGQELNFTLEEITSYTQFRRKYFSHFRRFPETVNPKNWDRYLTKLMENAVIEDAPSDASQDEMIFGMIYSHVNSEEMQAEDVNSFKVGRVIYDEEGVYFASAPVWEHLRSKNINITANEIYKILKARGCRHRTKRIGGETVKSWFLPYPAGEKPAMVEL